MHGYTARKGYVSACTQPSVHALSTPLGVLAQLFSWLAAWSTTRLCAHACACAYAVQLAAAQRAASAHHPCPRTSLFVFPKRNVRALADTAQAAPHVVTQCGLRSEALFKSLHVPHMCVHHIYLIELLGSLSTHRTCSRVAGTCDG